MSLLNKNHIKSLVAVGALKKDGSFACDSTSFVVGFIAKDSDEQEKKLYRTFLVTNRHVFDKREKVSLRFNSDDGNTKIFDLNLNFPTGEARWLEHSNKNVDLALLSVSPSVLKQNNIEPVFISEEIFGYSRNFSEIGIDVGDEVYAVGFPMGIAGNEQNYPCVKAGIISRIDKEIMNSKKAFIIDSSIFPGNSGGPVILKPTNTSLSGTKAVNKPYLIGVISGYIPYVEHLYTHQTNPPSVATLTRENSGLNFCVPIDFVKDIYDSWLQANKPVEESQVEANISDIKGEEKQK